MEWQEYLGGKLTPEQAQSAVAYNEFRSNVMAELNETLRMLSGAAVTAHEMERLREQLPSMNDSPTVFMAKLKASRRRSARAISRLGYVRRKGLDLEGIPLYRIDKIMETRGDELKAEAQRQNPGMSDADASDIANQQIASEFGVSFDDVGL
jgi:hypothetical protein